MPPLGEQLGEQMRDALQAAELVNVVRDEEDVAGAPTGRRSPAGSGGRGVR